MTIGRIDLMPRLATRQQGFTLVEVLVTVVILAIGLLGLAGLQAASLRFNSSANLRSQATNLAYDIVDRMHANRQAARSGAYDGINFENPPTVPAVSPSGTSIAAQDIRAWRNAMARTLPLGTGSIARTGDNITIVIQWDDTRGQSTPQQFSMMTGL